MEYIKEFKERFFLSAGDANAEGELPITTLSAKMIDIATAHANHLGIGNPYMPNDHTGWVLSRLTIEMTDYPWIDSYYTISTWVENWNRHFSTRCFSISDDAGNILGYARSIWMVLDTVTHANFGLDSLNLDPEVISSRECPIKPQAKHIQIVTPEEGAFASGKFLVMTSELLTHTFRYSDIDGYRHVNTVKYIAMLMNLFSLAEHDEKRVGRIELSFLDEGQYGEPLEIMRHDSEGDCSAFYLRSAAEHRPILYSRIVMTTRVR